MFRTAHSLIGTPVSDSFFAISTFSIMISVSASTPLNFRLHRAQQKILFERKKGFMIQEINLKKVKKGKYHETI